MTPLSDRLEQPVSYWYDAEVTVRVYLDASPATDGVATRERAEDDLTRLLDGVHTGFALLSVHGVELGELRDDGALHRPLRIAIDVDCPACGKPERSFDPATGVFACSSLGDGPCGYESTERDR